MKSLFSLDSPFGQKLTLLSNLVLLNLLWILCSIPIVTMGAATAAMYHVIFLYITNQDDAVIKPFFKAFAGSLKQATAVWLLHLLCGGMLVAEAFYLAGGNARLTLLQHTGHNAWDYTYHCQEIFQWLLQQRKELPPRADSGEFADAVRFG